MQELTKIILETENMRNLFTEGFGELHKFHHVLTTHGFKFKKRLHLSKGNSGLMYQHKNGETVYIRGTRDWDVPVPGETEGKRWTHASRKNEVINRGIGSHELYSHLTKHRKSKGL